MPPVGVAAGRYRVVSCAMAATHPVGANCVRPPLRHCIGTGAASGKTVSPDIPSQSPAVTALPEGEPRGLRSPRRLQFAGTPVFPKRANAPSCANRTPKAWLSPWENCRRSRLRGRNLRRQPGSGAPPQHRANTVRPYGRTGWVEILSLRGAKRRGNPFAHFPPASDLPHPTDAVGDDAHIVPHRFAFFTPFRR